QTLLFSATMPEPIARLAKDHLKSPRHVRLSGGSPDHQDIEQCLYVMKDQDRVDALIRLMELEDPEKAIIFCRTRRDVDELNERLTARGLKAKALHGDMRQEARMQAVKEIRKGKIQALIATDVASRGLDISDL